jgi:hypothetical protein
MSTITTYSAQMELLDRLRSLPDKLTSLSNQLDELTFTRTTVPEEERTRATLVKAEAALEAFWELARLLGAPPSELARLPGAPASAK